MTHDDGQKPIAIGHPNDSDDLKMSAYVTHVDFQSKTHKYPRI